MRLIHYTTLEGLHGIISSQKIRLTDARYLNDFTEIKEGISRLYSALEILNFSTTTSPQLKKSYETLQRELDEFNFYSSNSDPFFLCSFSRSPNRLSQWRSYGPVAIEFCAESLKHDGFNIRECVYDDNEKENLALLHASKLLKQIEKHVKTEEYGLDFLDSVSEFMHLSTTFKNSGFHEELEVRHAEQVGEDYNDVRFNISGGMLKPYIEKKFSYESLKAIHLGPVVDKILVRQSIDTLLNQVKRNTSANIEAEVDFIESDIPFRG